MSSGYGGMSCSDIARLDWQDSEAVKRFRAEAAIRVLSQAMDGAQWHEREPTLRDRELVAARRQLADRDEWWVVQRLAAIEAGLGGR